MQAPEGCGVRLGTAVYVYVLLPGQRVSHGCPGAGTAAQVPTGEAEPAAGVAAAPGLAAEAGNGEYGPTSLTWTMGIIEETSMR